MKSKKLLTYLSLFFIGSIFFSCSGSKQLTLGQITSPDYYMKFKGSEERLAQLMSGKFVCYSFRKKDVWRVNNGKDSLIAYATPVGDKNRQGTWVYSEVIMTNFPEEPALQVFYKITRVSPDSLLLQEFWPKSKDNSYKGLQHKKRPKFNETDLTESFCSYYVIKEGQTNFYAYQPKICESLSNQKYPWIWTSLRFQPKQITSKSKAYSTKEQAELKTTEHHPTLLYYKRFVSS